MQLSDELKKSYTLENMLDYVCKLKEQAPDPDINGTENEKIARADEKINSAIEFIAGLAFDGQKDIVTDILDAESAVYRKPGSLPFN